MEIYVLASIGNVQASPNLPSGQVLPKSITIPGNTCPDINWRCAGPPYPSKPSNPSEIHEKQINKLNELISTRIHQLASIGNVQASTHPPYFSKALGTVPNAMYDGNQYATKRGRRQRRSL